MSAIKQYTDLFDENRELIDRGSSAPLNARRADARKRLDGAELPDRRREGFERTSVEEMMEPDFGINVGRVNIPVDVAASFRCGVPNMSAMMGVVVNDEFHPVGALENRLPEGVVFTSLRAAAGICPEIIDRFYGSLATLDSEGVAINTMLAQDGVLLYVPKGVRIEKPLQLVNIFSSPAPLAAFRRLLVVMEEGASAQLLVCDHTRDNDQRYHSSQVTEVWLDNGAEFDIYDLEESSALTSRYWQLFARQNSESRLLVNASTLTCGTTRNEVHLDITGDHCSTMIAGMAIASGHQNIDNHIRVNHTGTRSDSRQLFKYVLDDEATGAFEGLIEVAEGAKYTEAYQSDKNLLASGAATMHTKPQLLIYCDDVKCSHGASTGQLDQKALFYMRQRGIDEKTARTMLMQAFMADVIDTVKMPGLQERLHMLVENRFNGRLSHCGDCASDCRQ